VVSNAASEIANNTVEGYIEVVPEGVIMLLTLSASLIVISALRRVR